MEQFIPLINISQKSKFNSIKTGLLRWIGRWGSCQRQWRPCQQTPDCAVERCSRLPPLVSPSLWWRPGVEDEWGNGETFSLYGFLECLYKK